jgi:hypothetical protein
MDVRIPTRFRGPPTSANGGYAAGLLARSVAPHAAEVTLRMPPPLERPLRVEVGEGGAAAGLGDGDDILAEAHRIEGLELEVPPPVPIEEAAAARRDSPLHHDHPFPGCFVCGPARDPGDGLAITPGPVAEGIVGAPWEVDRSLPEENGGIAPEIVWAALDCPGGISAILDPRFGGVWVLGRLSVQIEGRVQAGDTCLALGWGIGQEGRKYEAGSALYSADGEVVARGRATWIELRG